MGRIIKYNTAKSADSKRGTVVSFTTTVGYPTNNSTTSSSASTEQANINCTLWGNKFNGNKDLEGTMYVNGDIIVYFDEDDIDVSEYDVDEDGNVINLGGGNLQVQGAVEANSTYGKTIYLDYPEIDNKKTDLKDLLKGFDSRITTNSQDIEELDDRVENLENNGVGGSNLPLVAGSGKNSVQSKKTDDNISFCWAEGDYSFAVGELQTHSKGRGSVAMGLDSKANGAYSMALGGAATTYGNCSFACGDTTETTNFGEFACGVCNYSEDNSPVNGFEGSAESSLFTVGNGYNAYNRHNAFEIKQNGDIFIADTNEDGTYYKKPMVKLQDYISDIKKLKEQINQGNTSNSSNGKTIIDGAVDWRGISRNNNSFSGFVFQTDEGVVEFSPTMMIDSYDAQDGGLQSPFVSYNTEVQCQWGYDDETNTGDFFGGGYTQDIGYFNAGEYIQLNTITAELLSSTDPNYSCQIKNTGFTIYRNRLVVAAGEGTAHSYRVTQSGNYSVRFTVYGTHNKPKSLINNTDESICKVSGYYKLPSYNTIGNITPTGIAYAFAVNNGLAYIGSDCSIFKYGNYGLKICADGIYRFDGNNWVKTSL